MLRLIQYISIRHILRHKVRTFLTVSGVALGVAVVVAIQAVNQTVLVSFRKMIDTVAGRTTLQISAGPNGVPEDLWEAIERNPSVQYVAPVIQETVRVEDFAREMVLLLGIDFTGDEQFRDYSFTKDGTTLDDPLSFLNDPDAVLISERLSRKYGIKEGSFISVATVDSIKHLRVRGLLKPEGPAKAFGGSVLVMDIFAAQRLRGKEGRFDRYDVITNRSLPVHEAKKNLKSVLPTHLDIEIPQARGDSTETLLSSFQTGLNVASLVSLLVALFLIYNTMQISVTARKREIGILRALGAQKRDLRLLFLGESLIQGFFGSIFGIVLGLYLAQFMLEGVSKTVSTFVTAVNPQDVLTSPLTILPGLIGGVLASVLAAIGPARRAANQPPVEGIRMEGGSTSFIPTWISLNARISYALGLVSLVLFLASRGRLSAGCGYASQFFLVLSFAFMAPTLLRMAGQIFSPLVRRVCPPPERLAFDQIQRRVTRAAITLAAIMVGFAMVVEVSNYLGSLKLTVNRWIEQAIPADIFVTSGSKLAGIQNQPIREEIATEMERWPEVKAVDKVRIIDVQVDGVELKLLSNITHIWLEHAGSRFLNMDQREGVKRLEKESVVVVSENFLRKFRRKVGDTIPIKGAGGTHTLKIVGAIEDYTSDRGLIVMSRNHFIRTFNDNLVDSIDLYLRNPQEVEVVRQRILNSLGDQFKIFALTNREMKQEVMKVVDETYQIVHVLELVAVIVSMLGVINTLLASILERTRELGVLRAIGTTRSQIVRMILSEGALLVMGGMGLGIVLGTLLAQILVQAILPVITGWIIPLHFEYLHIFIFGLFGVFLATVAAFFPAQTAAHLQIVKAIEYE